MMSGSRTLNLSICLLVLVHQSAGITLTGSYYAVLDQTYRFTCTATEASAQQTLSFRKDRISVCVLADVLNSTQCQQFIASPGYSCSCGQNGVYYMNISTVSPQDEDTWNCQLSGGSGISPTSNTISLAVYYPPNKPTITNPGSLCEGKSTTLTCSSPDPGNPPAIYYWTKNSVSMATGRSYTFTPGRNDHQAQIRCEAGNNHTDRSGHSRPHSDVKQLNVYYVPRMTIIPAETQARLEGQNLSLVCSADSNPDNAVLRWSFNSISLPGSRLEKANLTTLDQGEYTCTGRVKTGSVCPMGFLQGNSHVKVNVFTAPPIPSDLIAWSTGPGIIKLSFKAAERDGLKQRFVVEYKEDGDTWKNSTESYRENGESYVQGYLRGLKPETLYFLRVKSVTHIGSSDFTEEVQVLTKHSISSTENQNSQESSRGNIILGIGIALIVVATAAALLQVFLFLKIKRSLKRAQQEQYASFQSRDGNTYDELKTTVYQNTELTTSE